MAMINAYANMRTNEKALIDCEEIMILYFKGSTHLSVFHVVFFKWNPLSKDLMRWNLALLILELCSAIGTIILCEELKNVRFYRLNRFLVGLFSTWLWKGH